MTRPPLELLDLLIRANAAAQNPGEKHEDLAEQFTQVMANPATGEQLRALRAQAEASKGLRKALTHYAEIRHYDHAGRVWSGDVDQHEDAQIDMGEIARNALSQADAGGGAQ